MSTTDVNALLLALKNKNGVDGNGAPIPNPDYSRLVVEAANMEKILAGGAADIAKNKDQLKASGEAISAIIDSVPGHEDTKADFANKAAALKSKLENGLLASVFGAPLDLSQEIAGLQALQKPPAETEQQLVVRNQELEAEKKKREEAAAQNPEANMWTTILTAIFSWLGLGDLLKEDKETEVANAAPAAPNAPSATVQPAATPAPAPAPAAEPEQARPTPDQVKRAGLTIQGTGLTAPTEATASRVGVLQPVSTTLAKA